MSVVPGLGTAALLPDPPAKPAGMAVPRREGRGGGAGDAGSVPPLNPVTKGLRSLRLRMAEPEISPEVVLCTDLRNVTQRGWDGRGAS